MVSITYTMGAYGQVYFTGSTTAEDTNTYYNWNFGDGNSYDYYNQNVAGNGYNNNGTYTVSLLITSTYPISSAYDYGHSNYGTCNDSASIPITVSNIPCNVNFSLIQDTIPHTWDAYPNYFSNVVSAAWYWGDGDSTIALYPSHTYSVAGWYNICVTTIDTGGCSSHYCQNDTVYRLANNSPYSAMVYINVLHIGATGINQLISSDIQLAVYPNPNNGSFVIEPSSTAKQTMQVYDVNGKLVLSQTINGKTSIDAGNLNEGVYNISLISNEGVVNKRLVIVR